MLFNSLEFIVFFLPLVVSFYWLINSYNNNYAKYFLLLGSFVFYGLWKTEYLVLLFASIFFNYWISSYINFYRSKALLTIGIILNLVLLLFFKYVNFFSSILNDLHITQPMYINVALPLAISFFTFQQIAYLVDSYQGKIKENNFVSYCMFICFFPQLISGPIVHHGEMMPQFSKKRYLNFQYVAVGITFFLLGMFKKVIIADYFAGIVNDGFGTINSELRTLDSWIIALSFTFQLYFDFSGYSDMAIGCGLMFGIFLPINFNSPLKANSIIDFWRRWHITLSRFLKEYLYVPLGGNRKGFKKQILFLMLTMILGGLWHGAAYNFLLWGGLHGLFLTINHLFSKLCQIFNINFFGTSGLAWFLTFTSVVTTFVIFRSNSIHQSFLIIKSMFIWKSSASLPIIFTQKEQLLYTSCLMCVILIIKYLPNTNQIMGYNGTSLYGGLWKPSSYWAFTTSALFLISFYVIVSDGYTEFLYRFF